MSGSGKHLKDEVCLRIYFEAYLKLKVAFTGFQRPSDRCRSYRRPGIKVNRIAHKTEVKALKIRSGSV